MVTGLRLRGVELRRRALESFSPALVHPVQEVVPGAECPLLSRDDARCRMLDTKYRILNTKYMPELFEQEEGEEEFDVEAAEREEERRLSGAAEQVDKTVSWPIVGALGLITSLFDHPVKHAEEPQKHRHERK